MHVTSVLFFIYPLQVLHWKGKFATVESVAKPATLWMPLPHVTVTFIGTSTRYLFFCSVYQWDLVHLVH